MFAIFKLKYSYLFLKLLRRFGNTKCTNVQVSFLSLSNVVSFLDLGIVALYFLRLLAFVALVLYMFVSYKK